MTEKGEDAARELRAAMIGDTAETTSTETSPAASFLGALVVAGLFAGGWWFVEAQRHTPGVSVEAVHAATLERGRSLAESLSSVINRRVYEISGDDLQPLFAVVEAGVKNRLRFPEYAVFSEMTILYSMDDDSLGACGFVAIPDRFGALRTEEGFHAVFARHGAQDGLTLGRVDFFGPWVDERGTHPPPERVQRRCGSGFSLAWIQKALEFHSFVAKR